jgi:hypothetical protein
MDRWFLKWYQLPGGEQANDAVLPLLPDRYTVDRDGLKLPPRVLADGVAALNLYQLGLISPALQSQAAAAILAAAPSAAGLKAARALVNLPLRERSTGWTLDLERGIVKFRHVVARLAGGLATNLGELQLEGPARVDLQFSHRVKPRASDPLTTEHFYSSFWERGAGGAAIKVAFPGANFARLVDRDDLQQVETLDGASNAAALDGLAQQLAQQVFARPAATEGAVVTLPRPVGAICTGIVRSVIHQDEGDLPRVVLHLGSVEPLYPVGGGSQVVTRAREPRQPISDQSFLRESRPRAVAGSVGG